ncbi:MAG: LuxR C-terminal-related transcriptional regulator [Ktedonobacteraceae bacterium]
MRGSRQDHKDSHNSYQREILSSPGLAAVATNGGGRSAESGDNIQSYPRIRSGILKVGLVDDYDLTRESISASLFETNVVSVFGFSAVADCAASNQAFDIILHYFHIIKIDLNTNDVMASSITTLKSLAPIIILCDVESPDLLRVAFKSGARGYIPTPNTTLDMTVGIMRLVKLGGTFVPPSSIVSQQSSKLTTTTPDLRGAQPFTPRQVEIIELLKQGKSNKRIAKALNISESSVKTHVQNILKKTNTTNRTAAVCTVQRLQPALLPN